MEKSSSVIVFLVVLLFFEGLQLCFCNNTTFNCIKREKDALLQLKQSLTDPSNRLVSWTGNDCCQWKGVSCNQNSGHVVKLDLRVPTYSTMHEWDEFDELDFYPHSSKKLYAMEINSCLVKLTHLQYLDLSGNNFKGSQIPKFLGSLKHLRYLNLSNAKFEGRIPIQLGNLTALRFLDLGGPFYDEDWDYFSGLYADNFQWISSLLSLKYIDMSYVNLSKALDVMQVLNTLPFLIHLHLDECGIQNIHFPHGFLNSTFLARVQFLSLQGNSLTGSIPKAIQNMTALRELDLSYQWNQSFGELYVDNFQWISSLASLQHLDMSYVNLSKALDVIKVLNTLPSLIGLRLNYCGIQNIHFPQGSLNSTFLARVQFLSLNHNSLAGSIPDAIQNMTALQELDLKNQWNQYFGELYVDNLQWVSNLLSLQHLDMRGVKFSKALDLMQVLNMLPSLLELHLSGCGIQNIHFPRGFVNSTFFASIQFLGLGDNELSGKIPDALQNMTSVRTLDLSANNFNSTIPLWLVNSKSLIDLNLRLNEFKNIEGGMLSMLNKACSLRSLDFSQNSFHNEVLGSKNNSSRCLTYDLEFLNLRDSGISGNLPNYFGQLKGLKDLHLSRNLFHGPIPSSFGELSNLQVLDLSNNQLKGIIPQWLVRFSSLQVLDLSNNQLNGTIPENFGKLSTLRYLRLSDNQLTGSIPNSLGQLVNLHEFDISSNSFQGVVSELHFANLSNLKVLDISSNHLTLKVKSDWIPPFNLIEINMSSCIIGSEFPRWVQTQTTVWSLDLSNASISGGFPIWLRSMYFYKLDLSTNQISGSLLADIFDTMPSLSYLLLGNNLLNGSMPNSLCKLENLEVLDLSRNKLTGELPHCWKDTQVIYVINLSYNMLSGLIPRSIGHLSILKRLHADKNNLTGELPLALRNCKELELLDLGENKFFGSIPTWIGGSLSSLQILRLRKNMLNGILPSELCQLNKLQILDLADNDLRGGIPHCFGKLKGMMTEKITTREYIELALGPISEAPARPPITEPSTANPPDYDTDWRREKVQEVTKGFDLEYTKMQLKRLDFIDLSSNKLVGGIPEELCLLSGLRGLNLSHNRLSRNIPKKIGELKLLESLDLSNNNLCGSIPPSMSALPSINHLNLSHNNLSGKIPTSNQLQTLIDPSIYVGNLGLCGDPLPKCPGDDDSAKPPTSMAHEDKDHEEDKKDKILFYFVVLAGYATGLWGVIGTLVFERNWRVAYFRFVDNAKEWILMMVAVKVARLKQMIQRTNTEE